MKKLALALMAATGFAWAYDTTTAFDAGKDFGQQQKGTLKGNVSSDGAQKNIPNYTTNTQEATLFNNGQGSLFTPGKSKVNNCATGSKADTKYNQQECDAVNFLAKNPQQRPQVNIDINDMLISGSTQIINNANSNGGFSGCVNTIKTKPATFEESICHEGRRLDQYQCSESLSVQVDYTCQPGTFSLDNVVYRNGCDQMHAKFLCEIRTDGRLAINVYAHGCLGAQGGWKGIYVYEDVSRYGPIPAGKYVKGECIKYNHDECREYANEWVYNDPKWVMTKWGPGYYVDTAKPHWEGSIRDVPMYILRDSKGCNGPDCEFKFVFMWERTSTLTEQYLLVANNAKPKFNITEKWVESCDLQ